MFVVAENASPVPVLAVTVHNMPAGLSYVLPERFEQRLRIGKPDPRVQVIYSGVMPADWPNYEIPEFPPAVRADITSPAWNMEAATQIDGATSRLA